MGAWGHGLYGNVSPTRHGTRLSVSVCLINYGNEEEFLKENNMEKK